ncbi:MAG: DUF5107 domain-containing protein [Saprospiraceae bacterium]
MKIKIVSLLFPLLFSFSISAQAPASIKEYNKAFTTYPFSDPDPIPSFTKIYPYFRYDGFTDTPMDKLWKVVELENDYIKVMILPEIGGKIWTAIEKSTNQSFIYYNHAVKFRDVAMRGPWTSGGLEPNYGIIGHTPNCATPVDYLTRMNDDGSASCIISVLDLLTRTTWIMEINLPKDKAYFTTASFWQNATKENQPYYHWMNTGIKAKGNLEFIYPGTHYIGHGGEYSDWPVNRSNGKKISFYEQNDFGGYKSYHVFGKYTNFFGGYWHDDEFGMARVADHADKAGKKIWIWGLSRQGMIWEKLLTDTDGQYVEVQSGRLFNQNAEKSTFTPFKHLGFSPYATDQWKEYWYPVMGTKGFVQASEYGALNIKKNENGWLKIYLSPTQSIHDNLQIKNGDSLIYTRQLSLSPLQLFQDSILWKSDVKSLVVTIGNNKLRYDFDESATNLDRPLESPKDFDWHSAYGLYLQGKESMDQKLYKEADGHLQNALKKDPNYLPAINAMAALNFRNLHYQDALQLALKALSIDTHDGETNYYYGIIQAALGNTIKAKDGFDISSISTEYRSAAYLELSKIYFKEGNYEKSISYASKSLDFNRYHVAALEVQAIAWRYLKNERSAIEVLDKILSFNPLSHFVSLEKYFWMPSTENKDKLVNSIKNELPAETYLELIAQYYDQGLLNESNQICAIAPAHTLIKYWKAFLQSKLGLDAIDLLSQADASSPAYVFPFRAEEAKVLEWAISKSNSWKPAYYYALLLKSRNRAEECNNIMYALTYKPDYAPFYAARAELLMNTNDKQAEADLKQALSMDSLDWRYVRNLGDFYLNRGRNEKALKSIEHFYNSHPQNYIIGMSYAKALMANKKYKACDELLAHINIIPFEGATGGRELYREAKLMQAAHSIEVKDFPNALKLISEAKEWPENIGVGKPYDNDIDSRLEDWMEYLSKKNDPKAAKVILDRITSFSPKVENTVGNYFTANHLVTAWAMEKLKNKAAGNEWLTKVSKHSFQPKISNWVSKMFNMTGTKTIMTDGQDASMRILTVVAQLK